MTWPCYNMLAMQSLIWLMSDVVCFAVPCMSDVPFALHPLLYCMHFTELGNIVTLHWTASNHARLGMPPHKTSVTPSQDATAATR